MLHLGDFLARGKLQFQIAFPSCRIVTGPQLHHPCKVQNPFILLERKAKALRSFIRTVVPELPREVFCQAVVMLLGQGAGLRAGDAVECLQGAQTAPVGEGMLGLQHAFRSAGARATLALGFSGPRSGTSVLAIR